MLKWKGIRFIDYLLAAISTTILEFSHQLYSFDQFSSRSQARRTANNTISFKNSTSMWYPHCSPNNVNILYISVHEPDA